jgi:hypothetical protein
MGYWRNDQILRGEIVVFPRCSKKQVQVKVSEVARTSGFCLKIFRSE